MYVWQRGVVWEQCLMQDLPYHSSALHLLIDPNSLEHILETEERSASLR